MTSSFSFSRLGKLITKQFYENSRLYTFAVLAIVSLLGLIFAFWIVAQGPDYNEENTWFIFLIGLFITGSIFAGMSFNMLGSKDKGIYWLGVPATHLEKLVCTILFTTVLFTLVYCLCFFAVKSISIVFLQEYIKKYPGSYYTEMQDYTKGFGAVIKYFIYGYFAIQALYLLGSVYFTRYSFILTTVATALLIFGFVYYITRIQHSMLGSASWNFVSARVKDPGIKEGYLLYSVSPAVTNFIKYAIQFIWAPLFWVVAWFRLKEKEI